MDFDLNVIARSTAKFISFSKKVIVDEVVVKDMIKE